MTFKKQMVNIREFSREVPTGVLVPAEGYVFGDFNYRKETVAKPTVITYRITHNPSGYAVGGYVSKAGQARRLCEMLNACPVKYDGKGEVPREFVNQLGKIIREFREGAL
jgi:hypothetical protein